MKIRHIEIVLLTILFEKKNHLDSKKIIEKNRAVFSTFVMSMANSVLFNI